MQPSTTVDEIKAAILDVFGIEVELQCLFLKQGPGEKEAWAWACPFGRNGTTRV